MPGMGWTFVAALLLTACQSAAGLPPTATTLRVVQATQVPTALHAIPSQMPGAPPTQVECQSTAALPTSQHTVSADISYEHHRAVVQQRVRTINRGSEPLAQVVFDVEPNRFPGSFTLDNPDHRSRRARLRTDQAAADGRSRRPFAPGCTLKSTSTSGWRCRRSATRTVISATAPTSSTWDTGCRCWQCTARRRMDHARSQRHWRADRQRHRRLGRDAQRHRRAARLAGRRARHRSRAGGLSLALHLQRRARVHAQHRSALRRQTQTASSVPVELYTFGERTAQTAKAARSTTSRER
ncbi:MAG: hypothetical protein U0521_24110 [Anaerolineae bacterium]